MDCKNLGLTLMLASLPVLATLEIDNKSSAQRTDNKVTIEEIINSPQELIGQVVSVRGETEDVESGAAFVISSEEGIRGIFGEDEVLVININNQPSVLSKDNADVQVTGQVEQFVREDIEREYGLNLDPELYIEYELKPVILASSIALAPEPGEVTKEPQSYYNKKVAIVGEVEDIVSADIFTLDENQLIGGSDLILLNLTSESSPNEAEKVLVTGIVLPFIKADLEKDYDLTWDLEIQEKIEAEYSNLPVLVVESISYVTE